MKCWHTLHCGWTSKILIWSERSQTLKVTYGMILFIKQVNLGNSLAVQWLGLCASTNMLHSRVVRPKKKRGKFIETESRWVGTSLVAQWLRIRLPMQGKRVRALVREDPTCRGATKPVRHNYWACALEPASHNYWARVPQLLKPACLEPVLLKKRTHHNEKPVHRMKSRRHSLELEKARAQQQRPTTAKNK